MDSGQTSKMEFIGIQKEIPDSGNETSNNDQTKETRSRNFNAFPHRRRSTQLKADKLYEGIGKDKSTKEGGKATK